MSDTYSTIVSVKARPAGTGTLRVEVIADLVCPFCFIGKRRLDEAMQAVHGPVETSWYPYQLNPNMPDDGVTLEDYLTERFGTPRAVQPTLDHLKAEGRVHGRIIAEPRGEHGFGYDPIFFHPESGCTTAEMEPEAKNRISHRAVALRALAEKLQDPQLASRLA